MRRLQPHLAFVKSKEASPPFADRGLISDHQHLETAIENGGPRERFIQAQETHSFTIVEQDSIR
jgi:hypothetical protein